MELYPAVHNDIGIIDCMASAESYGKCKQIFRLRFSKELVQKYASVAGTKNIYGEEFWRGDE